ncbi:MAG: Ig-like domain-containing protein [Methylobacter sp.]
MAINPISFTNTPQAKDDLLLSSNTELNEDSKDTFELDVMKNDLGGNAKTLYSLDNGLEDDGIAGADLLIADGGNKDKSLNGATIWIDGGKVKYKANTWNDNFKHELQHLAVGESLTDSFTYAIRLGNGTLSWATATVQIAGKNDDVTIVLAETVATGAVVEDADLTADISDSMMATGNVTFRDIDLSDTHMATFVKQGALDEDHDHEASGDQHSPWGNFALAPVSEAANAEKGSVAWTYTLNNAAAQSLAKGEVITEVYVVKINDGHGSTATQNVTITITGTNDEVLVSGAVASGAVVEDVAASASATGTVNFTDVDLTDVHTVTSALKNSDYDTAMGSFSVVKTNDTTGTGLGGVATWTYAIDNSAAQRLAKDQVVTEVHSITINDNNGDSVTQDVTVTITGSNDAPVAVADTAAGTENQILTIDVLGNDTDVDNNHVFTLNTGSAPVNKGSVSVVDNKLVFNPGSDFDHLAQGVAETVTLSYEMQDEYGAKSTSTVTVTVTGTNDAPLANNDTNALTVTTVASQNHDNTVHWVDWTSATGGGNGAPGTIRGTIDLGNGQTVGVTYTGEYQFAQTNGGTNFYTGPAGTYTSAAVANGPGGSSDIIALSQQTQKTLTFSQPVDNLFFAVVSLNGMTGGVNNGYLFDHDFNIVSSGPGYFGQGAATKVALPDGRFELLSTYNSTPTLREFHGVVQIDGTVQSLTWTSLAAENWNGFTIGTYGKSLTATASGNVLTNDSDPESDPLTVTALNDNQIVGNSYTLKLASGAEVTMNRDGSYLYDEKGAFASLGQGAAATDSFSYTVSDGHGGTATATTSITVAGGNDAPIAINDTASTDEDTPVSIAVLGNDTDIDNGDIKSLTSVAGAQHGSLSINGGNVIYTPTANYNGSDSFTYTMQDAAGLTSTATVNVTVNSVNDAPNITVSPVLTPISQWRAEGNANDSILPANNGALMNGATFSTGHNGGQAFSFDGVNDYVRVNREIQNDFTITGWIKTDHASRTGGQFYQGDGLIYADVGGVANDFGISILNNKIAFGTGNPDTTIQSTSTVTTGDWVHVAAVRQGATISLYVNGTLESSFVTANSGTLNSPAAITFGGNTVDGRFYQGLLDDVTFYNRALSNSEIQNDRQHTDGSGSVTEDANLTASGLLNATDVDGNPLTWSVLSANGNNGSAGTYGSLAIDNSGQWTYTLNNSAAVVQGLTLSDHPTENFVVQVSDGRGGVATQPLTIAVNGGNDAPTMTYSRPAIPAIVNGSFEGSTNGWTMTGGGVDVVSSLWWQPSNGSYCVDLNAYHPGGVQQVLQTVPGMQYTVAFDLSMNPGHTNHTSATAQVSVNNDAGTSQSYTYAASNTASNMMWSPQTFTFTATGNTTTLSFVSTYPNDNVIGQPWQFYAEGPALDNVRITSAKVAVHLGSTSTISGLSFSDSDADSAPMQLTLSVGHGSVALVNANGLTLSGSGGVVSYTGSEAALSAALAQGISYTPNAGASGADILSATIADQGLVGLSSTQNVDLWIA